MLLIAAAAFGIAHAAEKTWDSLGRLNAGARVEVFTADRAAKGEFVSSSTESLTIRTSSGEQKFARPEVVRVISRTQSKRLRNILIGAGAGIAIGLVTDQTLGTRLRNEGNLDNAALIWTLPIAAGAGIGAAIPSYPVVYKK